MTYADTSFLVALYVNESNSARAIAAVRTASPILLTPLSELEFANAVQLRVFCGDLSEAEAASVLAVFERNIAGGVFTLSSTPDEAYSRAMTLSKKWTATLGVRSLDILHVASALLLEADTFFSFDKGQSQLARKEGLKTR